MANPKKYLCEVKEIVKFSGDVYKVRFEPVENKVFKFKPGQFLHLTLDDFDPSSGYWPESRVFSIASSPLDKYIEIIYSVKGIYTSRMKDELKTGRNVWLKFPYGDFIIDKHVLPEDKIFIVAGGTGISPFISFLKFKKETGELTKYNIKLFYGIRNSEMFFYKDFLNSITNSINIEIIEGKMNIDKITDEITEIKSKCFISGPPVMINLFKDKLLEKGFDSGVIFIDEWN